MLEDRLQKQELIEPVKCIKCGKRNATKEDRLCDSCRFMHILENISKGK